MKLVSDQAQLFIEQPRSYSAESHEAWWRLYRRMVPGWERYANPRFRQGIASLCLDPTGSPASKT